MSEVTFQDATVDAENVKLKRIVRGLICELNAPCAAYVPAELIADAHAHERSHDPLGEWAKILK